MFIVFFCPIARAEIFQKKTWYFNDLNHKKYKDLQFYPNNISKNLRKNLFFSSISIKRGEVKRGNKKIILFWSIFHRSFERRPVKIPMFLKIFYGANDASCFLSLENYKNLS